MIDIVTVNKGLHIMDVKNDNNLDVIIKSAMKLFHEGNFRESIALGTAVEREEEKEAFPSRKRVSLRYSERAPNRCKTTKGPFPTLREVRSWRFKYGEGSMAHAAALQGLGQMETGLRTTKAPRSISMM